MGRNVLREYERLLVHNERFALADVVLSVHAVVEALTEVQRVLSAHASPSSSSYGNAKSAGAGRHHALAGCRKPTFRDVMDAIARRTKHVQSQIPLFLGDNVRVLHVHSENGFLLNHWVLPLIDIRMYVYSQEMLVLTKALREFVQMPEVESFWDLEMDASEKSAVDALSDLLLRLKTYHDALSAAITATAAVSSQLTAKRNVLYQPHVLFKPAGLLIN